MTTKNEASQRNELALIMAEWVTRGLRNDDAYAPLAEIEEAANVILAAGYRKPRIITTVAELDALALGTVLLGANRLSHQKELSDYWGVGGELVLPTRVALPAIVLYEPKAEAAQ